MRSSLPSSRNLRGVVADNGRKCLRARLSVLHQFLYAFDCQGGERGWTCTPEVETSYSLGALAQTPESFMYKFDLTEDQKSFQKLAREFTRDYITPVAGELDQKGEFPTEICKKAWELGLMNVEVDEKFGGLGLGIFDNCLINEELAYGCTGVATTIMGNTLASTPIMLAGTEAQQKEYLGRLIDDCLFASYATSEPDAGSDVAGFKCRYRKVGDEYILSGSKMWITNAGVANWFVVFATSDPTLRHKGISAFIVPADSEGLSLGKKEDKLGQRASDTRQVHLDEVRVPAANLLGAE